MTRVETILWLFDEMNCGAALLDESGSVFALNACAERILGRQLKDDCACRSEPDWAGKVLRRMFGKDFGESGGGIIVANGANSRAVRPIVACKMMLSRTAARKARVILLVVDLDERPRPRTGVLRQTFGLTEAESRIAARLALGESLQDIAVDHNVSIDTARAQLKSVLAKTRTHRQAEFVALVNRLAPLA
jgi:DNA-binding CsgD family transcriptional regulator